jgi:hypothetical protein
MMREENGETSSDNDNNSGNDSDAPQQDSSAEVISDSYGHHSERPF